MHRQASLQSNAALRSVISHKCGRRASCRVAAVAAPVDRPETDGSALSQQAAALEGALRLGDAAPAGEKQPAASTSGRVVLESADELKSTWEHRAWVGGTSLLLGGVLASGLAQVHDGGSAAVAVASALAAYVSADFGSAVYHWAVDNYGDGNTPLVGSQIAAFQGHHQRPWTITEREFCNNMCTRWVFQPAAPVAALMLAAAPAAPLAWDVWSSTFLALVCLSQQFHAWSHMKPSELHPAVVALQDAGLLISRKDHGAHHRAPFIAKYSIVSGWVNPLLDADCPENSFWRKLELFIQEKTGVEPRCWHETDYSWTEQERPEA